MMPALWGAVLRAVAADAHDARLVGSYSPERRKSADSLIPPLPQAAWRCVRFSASKP